MARGQEPAPSGIGPYAVVRVLNDGQSWLARDPEGAENRLVVIKRLEADCLLRGQLHPSIRDRLARVRELAHPDVANFLGVERGKIQPSASGGNGELVYLVWQYLPGKTLEEWVEGAARGESRDELPERLLRMAREVVAAVESLHALGIVHGALHERNIIIDEVGCIRLTHVSPLLYDAPGEDAGAVFGVLREAVGRCGQEETAVGWALETASGQARSGGKQVRGAVSGQIGAKGKPTLRQLAGCLSGLAKETAGEAVRSAVAGAKERDEAREIRRRAYIGALGAVVVGAIIFGGLWQHSRRAALHPPPVQNAPAAAMEEGR